MEALTHLDGSGSRRDRAFGVAGCGVLERDGNQEVTLFRTFVPLPVDNALRAAEPAGSRAHLSAQREVHADPERAARRAQALPTFGPPMKGPLEDLHPLVLITEHVRGGAQQLELFASRRIQA